MVGQLRNRVYRLSPEEAARAERTATVVRSTSVDETVLATLRAKQSVAEAILKG